MTVSSKPILYNDPVCMNGNVTWSLVTASGLEDKIEIRNISLMNGEQNSPEYLAKFPAHHVPALEHGHDLRIDESGAICRYIANIFPEARAFYPEDPKMRAIIDRAMDWRNTTFHPPLTRATYNLLWGFKEAQFAMEEVRDAGVKETEDALEYLGSHLLGERKFIAGDKVSLADFHIVTAFPPIRAFDGTSKQIKIPNRVQRWVEDVYEACPSVLANAQKVQMPVMLQMNKKFLEEFPLEN